MTTPFPPAKLPFVVVLHPRHNRIARHCLASLRKWAAPRQIFVVTPGDNIGFVLQPGPSVPGSCPVEVLDENEVIPGVSCARIAAFLEEKGANPARAGWYFQQFLKMSIASRPELGPYCVLWDADTILLRPRVFFDPEGRPAVMPSPEQHAAYFDTLQRLLALPRLTGQSFVSEHLVVETAVMRSLLAAIGRRHPGAPHWVWAIMESIAPEHLSLSGFSEYETYGNYLLQQKPGSIFIQKHASLRHGTRYYGPCPRPADLLFLALRYGQVTFESWEQTHPLRLCFFRWLALACLPVSALCALRRGTAVTAP